MSEPLSPWDRAQAAVTALAVDPAGLRGLWLRARSGPLRDRVVQALAALPLPQRRLHPGVDDATLYGGVDLSATLAHGQLVRAAGLLATPAALILTMAERCPPGLQMQLRFLCNRMLDQEQDAHLLALIERLQSDLIESAQIRLAPGECFALLTPLIEQRLQGIRLSLD